LYDRNRPMRESDLSERGRTMKRLTRIAVVVITCVGVVLLLEALPSMVGAQCKENLQSQAPEPESTRSAPPDTAPYIRPALPEDYSPGGKKAI